MTKDKQINILLVEDGEADIKIALRAFAKVDPDSRVYVVNDGEEALDFMHHEGRYQDKEKFPRPDLIILDINMPKMDGFQLLENIKNEPLYSAIPVIVLTTSRDEGDKARSYRNGAAGFISKPISYNEFVKVVEGFYSHVQKRSKGDGEKDINN